MTQEPPFKFGSQSLYKMTIQGKISDSWNDQIGPLKITQEVTRSGDHKTTLLFSTKDQAELMGFLNTIYEMHLPILSLTRVQKKQDLHLEK
jgi:hypothetical protein